MIVRPDGDNLLLITQPEHAALSARIMEAWRSDGLPVLASRGTVLLATREHDNGWREVDRWPTVDTRTGRPHHFMSAPAATKQGIWPRGVRRLEADDPAAAALVAQHALTVLDRIPTPDWLAFFAGMEAERDRILATGVYGNDVDALLADYRFVLLGDVLSLIFCCAWRESFVRAGYRMTLEGETLVVRPDPFEGRRIEMTAVARRVPARPYVSDDDLRDALAAAPRVTVRGLAAGAQPLDRAPC